MAEQSRVAVVILNYNGASLLEKFIPEVVSHSYPHEVIVVDNASTDNSAQFMRNNFPKVRLMVLDKNYGFAGGYNMALQSISAEYYILLNSDVETSPGWISPMSELLDSEIDTAACQPKILAYNQKTHFEYAGACGGYLDFVGYPFCRGRIFEEIEEDKGQYDFKTEVLWASGACLMIRSDVYHQLGGLDEFFFAHMEEIDLCWRINRSGLKVKVIPDSKVYHVGGATLSASSPWKTYLNFRNGILMIYKNSSLWSFVIKTTIKVPIDWMAGIYIGVKNSPTHTLTVFKAHYHAFLAIVLRKVRRTKGGKKLTPHTIYNRFIVLDYFLLSRRKFSSLRFRK